MNLAGLGYLAGGVAQGMDEGTKQRLAQLQAQAVQQSQSGQGDAGAAIMQMNGVTPPPQQQGGLGALGGLLRGAFAGGAQPPQAAAPSALATRPGGMGAPQPQMQQPQPQPQPPQGQPQGGAPPPQFQAAAQKLDFPTLTKALSQMPGMTPQRLMGALSALQPYMNLQAQIDYKRVMEQVAVQNAGSRAVSAGASKENADTNAAVRPKAQAETARHHKVTEGQGDTRLAQHQQQIDAANDHMANLNASYESRDVAGVRSYFAKLNAVKVQMEQEVRAEGGDIATDPGVKQINSQIAAAQGLLENLEKKPPTVQPPAGGGKRTDAAPASTRGNVSVDGGGQSATPDMSKAKRAADGKIYVPDPARPGKYLRVEE